MSLHIQLSPQAIEKLHKDRRRATIFSIVLSFTVVTLILVVLGMFLLPGIVKESPTT
jgi:predicted nucleic acid-binding Zn ribbon protein